MPNDFTCEELEKLAEFFYCVIFHLGWKKGYGLGLKEYGTDV